MIARIGVETTVQHGLENLGIATLHRNEQHEVMLGSEFVPQARTQREHCVGSRSIAACASGHEVFEGRKLVDRALLQ